MVRKRAEPKTRALAVSLGISAAILIAGFFLADGIQIGKVASRLLWPLLRLMFFITVGLAVGQVIESSGWTGTLAALGRPLFRFGNLGEHCSAAFTAAFFSGVSANAMLLEFYRAGKIGKRQLFLGNFVNQMPAYFLHLPTTVFIVIPLTRWAGALYFLLTFLAMLLRTAAFLCYGHFQIGAARAVEEDSGSVEEKKKGKGGGWKSLKERLPARIINIAVYVLPIYVFVYVINSLGFFDAARKLLSEYAVTSFIPMESLSFVILSFAAEFTSGFAAAGALLDAGALTIQQTVMALLIGNIIAFPVRSLRHQLPRYMGIFSPRMGAQLLLMGQGFRILSLAIMGLLFYLIL